MDSPLKNFFKHERDRVVVPGPFFSKQVIARLIAINAARESEYGFWELVAGVSRPVFALSLILFLGFVAVDVLIPEMPQRGMVEAYLEADQSPSESLLYSGAEPPNPEELFVEMMGMGEQ
jgi:hypothetical protein